MRATRIGFLLEELCTRHGFCLSALDHQLLIENPPNDPEAFTAEVYRLEGLDPSSDPDLYQAVRATIARAFIDPKRTWTT